MRTASYTRRDFLKGTGAGAASLVVASCISGYQQVLGKPARKRPNILFCLADDWSWPHAGIAGDKVVKTPIFDRVAREGVLFKNAFVTAPSCTPVAPKTRAPKVPPTKYLPNLANMYKLRKAQQQIQNKNKHSASTCKNKHTHTHTAKTKTKYAASLQK